MQIHTRVCMPLSSHALQMVRLFQGKCPIFEALLLTCHSVEMAGPTEGEEVGLMQLPEDIQRRILAYLPWRDLSRSAKACKAFRNQASKLKERSAWGGAYTKSYPPNLQSMSLVHKALRRRAGRKQEEASTSDGDRDGNESEANQPSEAIAKVMEYLYERARTPAQPDLVMVFMTQAWEEQLGDVYSALDRALPGRTVAFGCGASGIIGTDTMTGETEEIEEEEGIALACIRLPEGSRAHAFGTGCAGKDGSSLNTTLRRVKETGDASNSMAAIAIGDDPDALVAADGAIKSHFPSAVTIGGLGGADRHPRPLFVRSCEFQEANEVPGGPKRNCAVGCLIEGPSSRVFPATTRGVAPLAEPWEVESCSQEQVTISPGNTHTVTWVMGIRKGDGEIASPLVAIHELALQRGNYMPSSLEIGVRTDEMKRNGEKFRMCRPTHVDRSCGALAVEEEGLALGQGAELQLHAVSPAGSDKEISSCLSRLAPADGNEEALGLFAFCCCGRGRRWRGCQEGCETAAAREAVPSAPAVGFFCNGEFGIAPHLERTSSDSVHRSSPMGFTAVYGLLCCPAIHRQIPGRF